MLHLDVIDSGVELRLGVQNKVKMPTSYDKARVHIDNSNLPPHKYMNLVGTAKAYLNYILGRGYENEKWHYELVIYLLTIRLLQILFLKFQKNDNGNCVITCRL